ncbi:ATP synthase mitochondrial F1 complex assembly factor 1-like [Littorina saxatilis]
MSEMPGQRELLNICFACLRYSRVAQNGLPLVRPANVSNTFLRGLPQCSQCRFASSVQGPTRAEETKRDEEGIQSNPYFEKYKEKLKHLADADPDQFQWRLEKLQEEKKPRKSTMPPSCASSQAAGDTPAASPHPIPHSASYAPAKGLESVMKMELIQDKSATEVEQIWKEYHKTKDGVFAVLQRDVFEDLMAKSRSCPMFIFPLPRDDGFEFILMQFDGKDVQFTPLAMYQILKENAPACLTLVHYTELMDSKGIVLMSGQYDDKVLKPEDAVMLVQMIAIYYGKNSPRFDVVETFNRQPDKFDHNQLIEECKALYLDRSVKEPSQAMVKKKE